MSLARAALLGARPQISSLVLPQRRLASTSAQDVEEHHHHDEHHDSTQYPQEGFTSKGWTYSLLGAFTIVAFYKWAPAAGEENFVTRYIEYYRTPKETWEQTNNKHLAQSAEAQANAYLLQDARRPPIIRYRYPQSLEQASPYLIPVGQDVSLTGVKVKGDKDF